MDFILGLAIVVILAIALLYVGNSFRIPSIVCFLLIGMLAGPYGLGVISDEASIDTIGEIGIILLLFTIGLEFSFEKLFKSWRIAIIGGLLQVTMTIIAVTFVVYSMHVPFNAALVFGFIISLSSTAIVMKILQERHAVDTLEGRTLLGILIFQDLAIIPMILILPILMGGEGTDISNLPAEIVKVAVILVVVIVLARWIIPSFLNRVALQRNRELFVATIAGICISVAWLTSQAGLSFTLGAFVAGLIIGESDYNIDALSHIIPFRDVFAAVFFLSIGMLLNTPDILQDYSFVLLILYIVTLIVGIKILTGAFAAAVVGMPARICIFSGLALCQVGEFSFVLAKTGLSSGFIPDMVYQIFLASAIITMALTPVTMNASPAAVDLFYRVFPRRRKADTAIDNETGPEHGISDHIVIAGYGITGKSVARAAEIIGIPYTVIEMNPDNIRHEKVSRRLNFVLGDAVQTEVLEHAGICRARALVIAVSELEAVPRIVHMARSLAPQISIIARTRNIRHADYLMSLGADEVVSEEYEAAKEIFTRALRKYQLPGSEIETIVGRLQEWGYSKLVRKEEPGKPVPVLETPLHARHIQTLRVEAGSAAAGKTLRDLNLRSRYAVGDYSLRRGNLTTLLPDETTALAAGDAIVFYGTDETAASVRTLFARKRGP
jgi:CPA2 family monovalent cation:H+ antiporter-2